MRFTLLLPLLACLLAAQSALGEDTATRPTEKLWHIASYLKGTTDDVRRTMNQTVEDLAVRQHDLERRVTEQQAFTDKTRDAVLDEVRKSSDYRTLKIKMDASEKLLASARASGDTAAALQQGSDYNDAKLALDAMESHALKTDPVLIRAKADLLDRQNELIAIQPAITKATQWRSTLLEAIRESSLIMGPLQDGSDGILGTVTPTKIMGAHSMQIIYELDERVADQDPTPSKTGDGIMNVNVTVTHVPMIVEGIDTAKMQEGTPVRLDQTFVVSLKHTRHDDDQIIAIKESRSNLDELFAAIETGHEINPDPALNPKPCKVPSFFVGSWRTRAIQWVISEQSVNKIGVGIVDNNITIDGSSLLVTWPNGVIERFTLAPDEHMLWESWIPDHAKKFGQTKPDNSDVAARTDQ
jgi:hypothetical protein